MKNKFNLVVLFHKFKTYYTQSIKRFYIFYKDYIEVD